VAWLDENVAVRVKVVAGLDGLDREVVVDVGEPAVQILPSCLVTSRADPRSAGERVQLFPSALSVNCSERAPLAFFAAASASDVMTPGSSTAPLRRAFPLISSMALSTLAMVAARFNS
jgi:hypothetical protein